MTKRIPPAVIKGLPLADQSFAETGDVLEALRWARLALDAGLPVPPRIAAWLAAGIKRFVKSEVHSLDSALGVTGSGKADPRRKVRERSRLDGPLADMLVLHTLGATIDQAAALVAKGRSIEPLAEHYRRSDRGKMALRDRRLVLQAWTRAEVEAYLGQYADTPVDAALGKRRIRNMYAKHAT